MEQYQPQGEVNLTALIAAVAVESGRSQADVQAIVQATLDVIGRTVAAGHPVKLTNFGTFLPTDRHVAAGALGGRITEDTQVHTVRFRTSGRLRQTVADGGSVDTLKKLGKSY